jgi:osmotically-inducible protein OsmY
MKSNETLQKDVQDAIKWEPLLHAAEIGVTVKEGIVTLTGTVDSFSKKREAEDAAKNIAGVRAVVEKIDVKFGNWGKPSDEQVAAEVLNSFRWNWRVPDEKIKVKVEDGWVTLDGTVSWNYQKEAAKKAVVNLLGVKGVNNNLKIESELKDAVEKKDIEKALDRNWSIDANRINVKVHDNNVTLTGTVDSWYQRDEADKIAWNAPGVKSVENKLEVEYDYSLID